MGLTALVLFAAEKYSRVLIACVDAGSITLVLQFADTPQSYVRKTFRVGHRAQAGCECVEVFRAERKLSVRSIDVYVSRDSQGVSRWRKHVRKPPSLKDLIASRCLHRRISLC